MKAHGHIRGGPAARATTAGSPTMAAGALTEASAAVAACALTEASATMAAGAFTEASPAVATCALTTVTHAAGRFQAAGAAAAGVAA